MRAYPKMQNATSKAKDLRKQSTDAETVLWNLLRNRQLMGYKFHRQAPIGKYIVDFLCFERKLVVELDGGQHQEQANYDAGRTGILESRGYRVIRSWNNLVLDDTDAVLQAVLIALEEGTPSP